MAKMWQTPIDPPNASGNSDVWYTTELGMRMSCGGAPACMLGL